MSAGVASAYAIKILLNRGDLVVAPDGLQWDPFLNKVERTSLPGGHANPAFQENLAIAKKYFNIP